MNKKITASVLAGAMAISMTSISAFAADATQTVKASGEQTFSIDAGFTAPAIDVILPTSILAAINPYHLELEVDATNNLTTGTDGISSPEYEIKNNDAALGIKVAAKISAKGAAGVSIAAVDRTTKAAPTFKNDGTEEKQVFAYLNTTKTAGTYAATEYDPADATQLVFTEDVPDKATQLLALDASESGFFQIQGKVVEEPETKWATGDKVTLNVVFDINPYNPAIGGGGNTPTPPAVTPGLTADLTQTNFTGTGITAFAKKAGANNEYNITVDSTTNGGSAIGLNLTGLVDNSQTVTSKVADNANVTVAGMGMNVNVTPAAQGSSVVTITLSDNNTIVLNFTIT